MALVELAAQAGHLAQIQTALKVAIPYSAPSLQQAAGSEQEVIRRALHKMAVLAAPVAALVALALLLARVARAIRLQ